MILPELVKLALANTGKQAKHFCTLTNEVMIWVVVAIGLFTDMPIRQVFKASRRLHKGEASPARSSLCMARQRLGSEPLVELHGLIVKPKATPETPYESWKTLHSKHKLLVRVTSSMVLKPLQHLADGS